jgi:hypothetical protein
MIQYEVRINVASEEASAVGAVSLVKRETVYTEPDIRWNSLADADASIRDLLYRTQRLADMSPSFKFKRK